MYILSDFYFLAIYACLLSSLVSVFYFLKFMPRMIIIVYVQVVNDDGALLPCAINAACSALVDAGIPLKHLAVAICCSVAESGHIVLDPSKLEEQVSVIFRFFFMNKYFNSKSVTKMPFLSCK
ncbi:putative ribosomal protein S5 domain 2-type [Helianthus annuus]|nr:putative ribosomal protein S5 domain 2-type [Helianthus annuus]